MDAVCEECGDLGVEDLLLRCSKCKSAAKHRYCLDAIIFDSIGEWLCNNCIPKHYEATTSLEGATNQMQLRNTQFGSSIFKEPNAEKEKVTITWGIPGNRAHRKRNNHVDESTKHSSSGDTSNRGRNRPPKERGERNRPDKERGDAIIARSCSGDALYSCAIFGGDIPNRDNCEKEGEDKSYPTATSVKQVDISSVIGEKSEPLKVVKGLEKSVVESKVGPNPSKLIEGPHVKTRNAVVLKSLKQRLGSWSRVPMPSSPSNELEDTTIQENNAEGTRCLEDEETVTPIFKNRTSNPLVANECLVSNEGNSAEANRRPDEALSITIDKKMRRRTSVDREIVNSCKVNGISDTDSAQADPDASIAGMTSCLGLKKMILKRVLQEEGINSELSSSKFVGPCESTKINPRKRKQSESYSPNGIEYQKVSIMNESKNVNAARSKSSRAAPVASLRDCQKMPRKDNGSSAKFIGHSKKGKDKKMDRSSLARKASGGSRKTASDLQLSSPQKSYVDRSIPYSEDMDLALKESSCPLNNPRGSCAERVAEISSTTKELHDDIEPKKRRRLILPCDEEEDAEALHVVDLNSRSCDDDGHVKQQRKCVEKSAKNPRRYVEEDEEALRSGNLNHQCSNYYKQVNKQKRKEANKDKNEFVRNLNAGCAENDASQLASQTGVNEDRSGILMMPLISESNGAQTLDKPYWTGIMKIDENYIPLSAHLSIKAGEKVQGLSRSLPPIMKVTKLSTLKSCPKHLEAPIPSADSIDLSFFCGDTRSNKEMDQLVKHVADSGTILEAIVGSAKLCLFPSFVLPEEYQTFQGKLYLWGLFEQKISSSGTRLYGTRC